MKSGLSYLITVSKAHILPAQMLISGLRRKTDAPIVVVGNLSKADSEKLSLLGVSYLDENEIDLGGRMPNTEWEEKYRAVGWYKQMFIRLSIDRFMDNEQVVILDSEVFVFDDWDESRFYDTKSNSPRCFYWTPRIRKPDWDYKMYQGAAYPLSFLPECEGIMQYANSTEYKRHISGVVLFSTRNVKVLWEKLEAETDLKNNFDRLFNRTPELAFSDHDFYGLAVEYGLFERTVPTLMHNDLLGWYDNHDDPAFVRFKENAMWSMCQRHFQFQSPDKYRQFMVGTADKLGKSLPRAEYWNPPDRPLIDKKPEAADGMDYFNKYKEQLDYTFRRRYTTMRRALELLRKNHPGHPVIVEIGTLRDSTKGGGHSTYKFGEYCAQFGGELHTVDISPEAIEYSKEATAEFQPWINYHVSDSTEFLRNFDAEINLLYLDGYDSTPGNERAASQKQLEEIEAALRKLSERCVVLLDETKLPEGGKAGKSSGFLLHQGFELAEDGYQQVFFRESGRKNPVKRTGDQMKKFLKRFLG